MSAIEVGGQAPAPGTTARRTMPTKKNHADQSSRRHGRRWAGIAIRRTAYVMAESPPTMATSIRGVYNQAGPAAKSTTAAAAKAMYAQASAALRRDGTGCTAAGVSRSPPARAGTSTEVTSYLRQHGPMH